MHWSTSTRDIFWIAITISLPSPVGYPADVLPDDPMAPGGPAYCDLAARRKKPELARLPPLSPAIVARA
jgi:hypothetical protein